MDSGWDLRVLQTEGCLDERGQSGYPHGVPDVRLHRTHGAELLVVGERRERLGQPEDLDRISEPRARSMGLEVTHRRRREPSPVPGRDDHVLLRLCVGSGDPVSAPVVVGRHPQHDAVNRVSIGQSARERLHQERGDALTPDRTVRSRVKRPHPRFVRLGLVADTRGTQEEVRSRNKGRLTVAVPQRRDGRVEGDQGG